MGAFGGGLGGGAGSEFASAGEALFAAMSATQKKQEGGRNFRMPL